MSPLRRRPTPVLQLQHAVLVLALFVMAGCTTTSPAPEIVGANGAQPRAGQALFVSRCIECHTLPDPHRYPAAAWPGLVDKMAKRAGLKPAERDAIVAYVQAASTSPR